MTIPIWLSERIHRTCPYCGAEIANNDLLTDRYCSNPKCPEHMAHKIDELAKRFGIKNFGVASARTAIRAYGLTSHMDIIPKWFDKKPEMFLHEVGEICLFKGYQKRWREYCAGCDRMMDVVKSGRLPPAIQQSAFDLLYAETLVCVKPRLLGKRVDIMMSGSFNGYRARADFVAAMNAKYGDIVQLVDVGKRKTSVDYLVKERHATDHEKSAIAHAYGIPILTPAELEERIAGYCTYMHEGGLKP